MSAEEAKRRRDQSERDRKKEQDRRDRHLHDEAVFRPRAVAGGAKPSSDSVVGIGHNRGPPLDDQLIWGARAIAIAAGLVDASGRPRVRAAFHLLQKKLLPASKVGKTYVSSMRRLQSIAGGE
jgi:hypothetical protein